MDENIKERALYVNGYFQMPLTTNLLDGFKCTKCFNVIYITPGRGNSVESK